MPMKEDTTNMLGYYDESWAKPESEELVFSMTLGEVMDLLESRFERWPVRNREPREPISSQKRAIIHERDGGACLYCGDGDSQLVLDHIVPRSAFLPQHLAIADRSDNLQSACWPCNEQRSNFETHPRKKLGVVVRCWYCKHPEYERAMDCGDEPPIERPDMGALVYCGGCGITNVPQVEGWVL